MIIQPVQRLRAASLRATSFFAASLRATSFLALFILSLPMLFTACVKDNCSEQQRYTILTPVYKSRAEVIANVRSNAPRPVTNAGKMYVFGNYLFLNDVDKGVHLIDNSNPSSPRNVAFIDIPGNVDIAVKGNTLYADFFTDLLTIDITDPLHATLKMVTPGLWEQRNYGVGFTGDDQRVIVDWNRRDTVVRNSCDQPNWILLGGDVFMTQNNGTSFATAPTGIGGSMARFTIVSNRLYTVTTDSLHIFDISQAQAPRNTNNIGVGWNIETIYPFADKLFMGSSTGMYMYGIGILDQPEFQGMFAHATVCDPVIADANYAYVTLRSGSKCAGFQDELDVIDIDQLRQGNGSESLIKRYDLFNPHGLTKVGNKLYICDGEQGLKVFDATDVMNIQQIASVPFTHAYDVIALPRSILVTGNDGLYQYDPGTLQLLSKFDTPAKR